MSDAPDPVADAPPPSPTDVWLDLFRRTMEEAHARPSAAGPPPPGGPPRPAWRAVAADLLARVKPRDPVEELLVAQMLCTHARALVLASRANRQRNAVWFRLYSDHCQQAAELFRRQMLALDEYRRPRRRRRGRTTTINSIRTANIAQFTPLPAPPEAPDVAAPPAPPQAALPLVPRRPPVPPAEHPDPPTLD